MKTQIFTRSVREGLAVVAADAQHSAAVVAAQTVAVKKNAAKRVPLDNVHSLLTEVTDVGRRGFPEDQRLGILHASYAYINATRHTTTRKNPTKQHCVIL